LFPLLYDELRRLAAAQYGAPGSSPTLQPTALVHEVWLRLANAPGEVRGREHFLAIAARAMRQVLVDHARRRDAHKRGGAFERVTLDERIGAHTDSEGIDFLALDEALGRLARIDERAAQGAELRLLAGLSSEEIALVQGVTPRTVQTDWRTANAWLTRELG
jgi:RNA polymerase sigma factor (TIGR02999 family)